MGEKIIKAIIQANILPELIVVINGCNKERAGQTGM
jgi:hypothetical protein